VFDILDLDPNVQNFTVSFDQTVGPDGIFLLNSVSQGLGNVLTITDSKANINAANVTFVPYPSTSNSLGFTYSQSKLTTAGNVIVQANSVPITATCPSPTAAYTLDTSYTVPQNERASLDFTIPETDARANLYNITIQQVTPDVSLTPGLFQSYRTGLVPGSWPNINGNVAVISDSKNNINAQWGNISYNVTVIPFPGFPETGNSAGLNYYMPSDQTSNVTLAFTLSKNNSLFGNITLANAEPITVSPNPIYGTYSLPYGNTFTVNQDSAVPIPILVENRDRRNLISSSGAVEEPWGGAYRYWLNNITPSGNNLQGRFYIGTGFNASTGNVTGNILSNSNLTPVNPLKWTVGATNYTQDTEGGYQWYKPGPQEAFYITTVPGTFSDGSGSFSPIYYPPPNYVGNVQLSVDITKSRIVNGVVANVVVANAIPFTIQVISTSPTLFTGPANATIAAGNTHFLLANIGDPVGRNLFTLNGLPNPDFGNGRFHGLYSTTVSIPDTTLGNIFYITSGANTNMSTGTSIGSNAPYTNRTFSGNILAGPQLAFRSNGNAGNVVLTTTVIRGQPDSPDTVIGNSTATITIT
jgi:hypothetical protein